MVRKALLAAAAVALGTGLALSQTPPSAQAGKFFGKVTALGANSLTAIDKAGNQKVFTIPPGAKIEKLIRTATSSETEPAAFTDIKVNSDIKVTFDASGVVTQVLLGGGHHHHKAPAVP